MKSKIAKHVIVTAALVCLTACATTKGSKEDADVLGSLSKEQQHTLLTMLEEYQNNQNAIDSWKQHETSLVRLSEIEGDLKTLIMQLSVLAQPKPTQTSNARAVAAKGASVQPTREPATIASTTSTPTPTPTPTKHDEPKEVAQQQKQRTGYAVQLTALYSVEKLKAYWHKVKNKNAQLLSAYSPIYESTLDGSNNTILRLKFGEFDSYAAAKAVCSKLTNNGSSCFVAKNNKGEVLFQ